MIITFVRFPGTETASVEDAAAIFAESAGRYLDVPGLMGKAYLRAADGSVGALYWWTDRDSAAAKFNPEWVEGVTRKYGAAPVVDYFDAPIVVDGITRTIRTEPPAVVGGQADV